MNEIGALNEWLGCRDLSAIDGGCKLWMDPFYMGND